MRGICAFMLSMFAVSGYANSGLPDYGQHNLITDEDEKHAYLEALKIDLESQGIQVCEGEGHPHKWRLTEVGLNPKFESLLYRLESETPLFVLRAPNTGNRNVDVVDIKFFTDPEMSKVIRISFVGFSVENVRVNEGSLSEPNLVWKEVVTKVVEADCE